MRVVLLLICPERNPSGEVCETHQRKLLVVEWILTMFLACVYLKLVEHLSCFLFLFWLEVAVLSRSLYDFK